MKLLSNRVAVELLWTLKSHSLGQSEDQTGRSPIFISFLLISSLEVLHLMVPSLVIPFYSSGAIHVGRLIPLQVFFNSKLGVHPHCTPACWQHLPTIRV
jgi:hypothetical protein